MTDPVRLLIHGVSGRMGQALLRLSAAQPRCQVVAAIAQRAPAQRVVDGVPFFSASELSGVPAFDAAIDFSMPEGFDPILALCVARGAAMVSGTTGLSTAQRDALASAAASIPVLWASNFSLGVAVLAELVERAVAALPGWDCDVIEVHHSGKKDAPSGTALTLGEAAAALDRPVHYASIRAGDIVGEHSVQFTGPGERLELVHRAGNRDIFARGALHAAVRLVGKAPAAYRVRDLLD